MNFWFGSSRAREFDWTAIFSALRFCPLRLFPRLLRRGGARALIWSFLLGRSPHFADNFRLWRVLGWFGERSVGFWIVQLWGRRRPKPICRKPPRLVSRRRLLRGRSKLFGNILRRRRRRRNRFRQRILFGVGLFWCSAEESGEKRGFWFLSFFEFDDFLRLFLLCDGWRTSFAGGGRRRCVRFQTLLSRPGIEVNI